MIRSGKNKHVLEHVETMIDQIGPNLTTHQTK